MKKLLIALALVLAWQPGSAQTVENVIENFKEQSGVEFVPLNKEMLQMAMGAQMQEAEKDEETGKVMDIIGEIETLNVLSLEDAGADVKKAFLDMAGKLDMKGFETIVDVNDNGEQVTIYGKKKKEKLTEVVIIVTTPDEPVLIQIKGNIRPEDINTIVKMNN